MRKYELLPTDGRKSFYGKAIVVVDGNTEILYSYGTKIASKDKNGQIKRLWGGWSQTTGRHIKAFCGLCKADWMKLEHEITPSEKAEAYEGTLFR